MKELILLIAFILFLVLIGFIGLGADKSDPKGHTFESITVKEASE